MSLRWPSIAGLTLLVGFAMPSSAAESLREALPFDLPPLTTLRQSPHKVFAHYFPPFPISMDNKPAGEDYYTRQYLSADGENGKHRDSAGYLRERPLPRPPRPEKNWADLDLEEDVRRAVAIGLDGFVCDILRTSGPNWDRARALLDAAQRVDPGFKIVLMPDLNGEFGQDPDRTTQVVRTLGSQPAAYRTADGRLVVAPFNAQAKPAAWWKSWLDTMRDQGTPIAFFPLFQNWRKYAPDFAPISYGLSDWGPRSPSGAGALRDDPAFAHRLGMLWMAPVSPQDMRPKDLKYWEASNTLTYRTMWESAIGGGADWVQVITWNDYSESTEIAPSTGTQYVFYDLTAYYTTWFKTGSAPPIRRDVLYYTLRSQLTDAAWDRSRQSRGFTATGWDAPRDEIELLAFLKEPGTLEISLQGPTRRRDAPAGLTSFRVPAAAGRPTFALVRDGQRVVSVESSTTIVDRAPFQDLLYRGGSSSRRP